MPSATKPPAELRTHGGKETEPHKAAMVGDTVDDPFNDMCTESL